MQKKNGHLFLYINIIEPHQSYQIKEPFFSEFTKSLDYANIGNFEQTKRLFKIGHTYIYTDSNFVDFTDESYAYIRAVYDSEIAYVDHHFGLFSDRMRELRLLDQTLLVITSDHGEFLGEHYSLGHPELFFNPVIVIPQILRYPFLIEPAVLDANVSNVDLFPTILNLMGYSDQIPEDVEGMDILRSDYDRERFILSEVLFSEEGCYALIQGSTKLMVSDYQKLLNRCPFDTLLFNLEQDPKEEVNSRLMNQNKCDSLISILNRWVGRIRVQPTEETELSPELLENLRALGYIQ